VIDVTVSKSENVIQKKMTSFLDAFLLLGDKNTTHYEYKFGLKTLKFPVKLRYFIFCQKDTEKDLLKNLSKD
jgi:hypothetical protein